MSGFAGVISLDGAPPDTRLLERMADSLAFRGPDGTHITTKAGAGFCFTFLKTGPAPQCPSQPCSLEGRVWLLGDVRLDGREDLRRKLEQHGDQFAAEFTDEELVLRAWRRWGQDSLPELMGDYAFALWDAEAHVLWCARDLMGARPFFYAQTDKHLYFSNTLKTIRCAPDISSVLDDHFIGDFLLQGWCSYPERTAFRDVQRLPAGHMLGFSSSGLEVRRHTSLPVEESLWLAREEEYVERFRELLETAIRERLPVHSAAIFMSGGLDSTTVAAIAAQCGRKAGQLLDLRAFTLDYQPLFDDQEGLLASLAAQHIGIPIEVHPGAHYLPYAGWDSSLPFMPEPSHEPFHYQYVEQNRQVARHARVAFNGYGGDGVLTGQTWPFLKDLARQLRFATICELYCGYIIRYRRIPPLRAGLGAKLRRLVKLNDPTKAYPVWVAAEFAKKLCLRQRWCELQASAKSSHPWHAKAHATLSGPYWSMVLESDDAAITGAPLESRSPLLDLRIQRFLLRVPPLPLCINKELIRRAVLDLLPERIRSRSKTPFEGDQVALHIRKHGWSPLPVQEPPKALHHFVDWGVVRKTLETSSMRFPWPNLRPFSLLYWIRSIENDRRNEYSQLYGP